MKSSSPTMADFSRTCGRFLTKDQMVTDPLRTLCWGTDASFYRLIPQIVLIPETEAEVAQILAASNRLSIPVTFRAAGTSLSGQAISDSVLIVVGKKWEKYTLSPDAETIRVQPGLVGARVNEILAPLGRRIAPDPASLASAMIGGILANNASGMNCGIHGNPDRVLRSAKILFADGTTLDTGDEKSRADFARQRPDFLEELATLQCLVRDDAELSEQIRRKYRIKNVTGLNLLPLLRNDDLFDMIAHLMVGSEGTLAFLAEATLMTEKRLARSASAMVYFPDLATACRAVQKLRGTATASVELLDRQSLRSVEGRDKMPAFLAELPSGATALLLETRANTPDQLNEQIVGITDALTGFKTLVPVEFTDDDATCAVWWGIRSGIFPSVGGMRPAGTTTLIEDIAFPVEVLPEATVRLREIIDHWGYHDGVIYGHAQDGNLHFILNPRFDSPEEIARYEGLMRDTVELVVEEYGGSLKAEHGTGRNMAPFVEREWGEKAFGVMKRLKRLFDPKNCLNPGVIFNDDPQCFVKNLKQPVALHEKVDRCIECGFCEVDCVTAGLTLSSRQRIVAQRDIARNATTPAEKSRKKELVRGYRYYGDATCAGDGLCSRRCPMAINTGDLTHAVREQNGPPGSCTARLGNLAANHLGQIETAIRPVLGVAHLGHKILGTKLMSAVCNGLHRCGVPLWTPAMPKAHHVRQSTAKTANSQSARPKVVYFPSCINQTFGVADGSPDPMAVSDCMIALLDKAGYDVIFPEKMSNLCCGTIWESKGMPDIAERKTRELEAALLVASEAGRWPVLCDQSPCLYRMRHEISSMPLYEPVEFIETFLVARLDFLPVNETIAIHTTCSMTKMGLFPLLKQLAERCAARVVVPEEVGCCGFAGDRGFTHPEVNRYGLRKLRPQLEQAGVTVGYSNSRTCEIGLSTHGGVPYLSIVSLVNRCTKPKNNGS